MKYYLCSVFLLIPLLGFSKPTSSWTYSSIDGQIPSDVSCLLSRSKDFTKTANQKSIIQDVYTRRITKTAETSLLANFKLLNGTSKSINLLRTDTIVMYKAQADASVPTIPTGHASVDPDYLKMHSEAMTSLNNVLAQIKLCDKKNESEETDENPAIKNSQRDSGKELPLDERKQGPTSKVIER